MSPNQTQLHLRLSQRCAGLESCHNSNRMWSAALEEFCSILPQRRQQIRFGIAQPKAGGRDSHNRVEFAVESNRSPEGVRPSREMPLPETVAEYCHGSRAWPIIRGQKSAPLRKLNAQDREDARRYLLKVDMLGVTRPANRTIVKNGAGQRQRTAFALAIQKVRIGNVLFAIQFRVPGFCVSVHRHKLVGLGIWQWPQQN